MREQLLPQPPPDVPAPPAGEEARHSRKKMAWLVLAVVALPLLGGVVCPLLLRSRKDPRTTETMSNLRHLHRELSAFDLEYGSFPDASTAPQVKKATGTSLTLGDRSSNELLIQLLVTGHSQSEQHFHVYSNGSRRPDDIYDFEATALAPGECSFAYVSGLSSADDSDCPIVFGPVIPGTRNLDVKAFDRKAIVLRLDGSVSAMNIHPSGEIGVTGMDMLDSRQPYWNGRAPQVKWPR